jgi:hypothetical protein
MTRRTVLAAERAAAASPRGTHRLNAGRRPATDRVGGRVLACRRGCPRVTAYAAATFADRAYAARFDPCAFPASADLLAGLPHMPMSGS